MFQTMTSYAMSGVHLPAVASGRRARAAGATPPEATWGRWLIEPKRGTLKWSMTFGVLVASGKEGGAPFL